MNESRGIPDWGKHDSERCISGKKPFQIDNVSNTKIC